MLIQPPQIFLASSSPRRQELLIQLGLRFELLPQAIDERVLAQELASTYALRLSQLKAAAGVALLPKTDLTPVLGADTTVVVCDQILGKPNDYIDGVRMLRLLSGTTHHVITAVTLANHHKSVSILSSTQVTFKTLTLAEIDKYWLTGEPTGKAGSYAIQGLGAIFVEKIVGSYSAVVGLPIFETAGLLPHFSIEYAQN